MAVHPQRTTWTDERLDDLNQTVRDGFARNDAEHRAIRQEMREGFDRVDQRFDRIDQRFERIDERFDALQRALIIAMAGLVTAILVSSLFS